MVADCQGYSHRVKVGEKQVLRREIACKLCKAIQLPYKKLTHRCYYPPVRENRGSGVDFKGLLCFRLDGLFICARPTRL